VEAADRRYTADTGQHAQNIEELMTAGYLLERPIDPFGGRIVMRGGRADSTASRRLEVYQ
jgi:hypothetical protein